MNKERPFDRSAHRALWFALPAVLLLSSVAQGMYDPHHGRWFQRDPLGVRPERSKRAFDPKRQYQDGMDLYQYARSKPSGTADWDGRCAQQTCTPSSCQSSFKECQKLKDPRNWPDDAKCMLQRMLQQYSKYRPIGSPSCLPPNVTCKCCNAGIGGWHRTTFAQRLGSPTGDSITLCYQSGGDCNTAARMQRYLTHEVAHAFQECMRGPADNCEELACREIQAYVCDGTCRDFAYLLNPDTGVSVR